MLHHVKAVRRGVRNALQAADMPDGSYQIDPKIGLGNATRFVKEAGAEMVKIEGGESASMSSARSSATKFPWPATSV